MLPNSPKTFASSWRSKLLTRRSQFTLDTFVVVSAFTLAYLLRFDFALPAKDLRYMLYQLPFVLALQLTVMWAAGIYAFVWRYIGMAEIKAFVVAALWSAAPMIFFRIALPEQMQAARVPLSITVMDTVFAFGGVLSLRVMRRAWHDRNVSREKAKTHFKRPPKKRVLLIGAGRAGVLIAKEIQFRAEIDIEVKGFIDDNRQKVGSVIQGVKVLGTAEDIPRLVKELTIDHVVISFTEASRREFRRILDICKEARVKVRTVPGIYELLQGNVKVTRIRDVQIEDLLGRKQVELDERSMQRFLAGKTVMVTGAGGSIGSELVRQIARFRPASLLLVERAEFALFAIEHEMRRLDAQLPIVSLVADINDRSRMTTIFQTHGPQVILHAAAHKHVPMMELNPCEAVKNNVMGTRLLGELALDFGAEAFVLISTDKAVRPSSVMGASKRLAELVIQDLDRNSDTRFLAVRFGNVIGSAGSVIPIFTEQIRNGGPVTVTHPEMVRYFMTIPEAAQLVLQAGALGSGGEIFVLDMGDPVRILDLAKETITLSGLKPFDDINIVFTGIRPGEKLYEELQTTDERLLKTRHPKIFIGKIAAYSEEKVRHGLERLAVLAENGWDHEVRKAMNDLLPEAQLQIPTEDFTLAPVYSDRLHAAAGGN